jgi:hypothetical protein
MTWLQRIAAEESRRALASIRKAAPGPVAIVKVDKDTRELMRLIEAYGVAQIGDAAERTIRTNTGALPRAITGRVRNIVAPGLMADYLARKTPLLAGLASSTRRSVREQIRALIESSLRESPQPSAGEIARRIRTAFHGTGTGTPSGVRTQVLPTGATDIYSTESGTLYAISSERAAAIARTELVQLENTGIYTGYEMLGAKELEWLSVTSDTRSGARQHWKMNGQKRKMGVPFRLPSGVEIRYPGDPEAPIGETINCRCSMKASAFKVPATSGPR